MTEIEDLEHFEQAGNVAALAAVLAGATVPLKIRAAEALERLGSEEALGPLADALTDRCSHDPTEGAEDAARLREWASEEVFPVRDAAKKALMRILTKDDPQTSFRLQAEGDVGGLVAILEGGTSEQAKRLWQRTGDREGQAALGEVKQKVAYSREWAARKLWTMPEAKGDPGAIEALRESLSDEFVFVRKTAISALAAVGGPQAVLPLVAALKDEAPEVRACAAGDLGGLGDRRAVEPLVNALSDWHDSVRQWAASSLGKLGGEEAVRALEQAVDDPNDKVREWVVRALAHARPEPPTVAPTVEASVPEPARDQAEKKQKKRWSLFGKQ